MWHGRALWEALPMKGCDGGTGCLEYTPGGGRGPRNREEGHTSPTYSLAHSLEPTHNHMPGLATADGPADLPMCGVCPVVQPDGFYRTK